MAISVNPITRVIYVPKADLTLVQASPEVRELDVNAFRLWLKDWEDNAEGIVQPKTHDHNAEVALAGLVYARIVEILAPYTVEFENGQYTINCVGANHNLSDVKIVNEVSLIVNNAAGLISSPAIEFASFEGGVWIDPNSTTSGTIYPAGTRLQPVNNLADAKLIAGYRGLTRLYIMDNFTLGATDDVTEYIVEGSYHDRTVMTLTSGVTVADVQFNNLSMQGNAGSDFCVMENCSLRDISNLDANVYRSELSGTLQLDLGTFRHWIRCTSNKHTGNPTLDFQNTSQDLVVTGYTGGLGVTNMNAGSLVVYLDSGYLNIASSCTGGTITVFGTGGITDASTAGCTVVDSNLVNPIAVTDSVWDEALSEHTDVGSAGEALGNVSAGASPALIAGAVWDKDRADHTDAGSFGATGEWATAIDANGLATALWGADKGDHNDPDTMGELQNTGGTGGGLTQEEVAEAVWDALSADHEIADTMGAIMELLSRGAINLPRILPGD